jgi:hypothetical protein
VPVIPLGAGDVRIEAFIKCPGPRAYFKIEHGT